MRPLTIPPSQRHFQPPHEAVGYIEDLLRGKEAPVRKTMIEIGIYILDWDEATVWTQTYVGGCLQHKWKTESPLRRVRA